MTEILVSVISSVGLTGLVAFLTRNWLIERLRLSIKYEYDEKLEKLKVQLLAESNAALEQQSAHSARELEKFKSELQRDAEEYKIVAGSEVGGYVIIWVALEELVSRCIGLHERYSEHLDESDEPTLQSCMSAYRKAKKVLSQVSLIIGQELTGEIEMFLESFRSELDAFRACVCIKKLRAGILTQSDFDIVVNGVRVTFETEYDFCMARSLTRQNFASLLHSWRNLKIGLRRAQKDCLKVRGQV